MKPSVAITLIVCGTILIALPYIQNAIVLHQMTETTRDVLYRSVHSKVDLPQYANIACMLGGMAMILIGIFSSPTEKRQ